MPKKKQKGSLRDLRKIELSWEEGSALAKAFMIEVNPIAVAVTGAEFVEHELDRVLYKRLRVKDNKTWHSLTAETGPLSTFHRKIVLGATLRLYNDRVRHDLIIIKDLRNAFAHNRKVITFGNELVQSAILSVKTLTKKYKNALIKDRSSQLSQSIYILVCLRLHGILAKKLVDRKIMRLAKLLMATQKAPATARSPRMGDILGKT